MALPIWPTDLPSRPLRENYDRAPAFGPATNEFEDGPTGSRRWSRIRARLEVISLAMTTSQFAAFEEFVENDLGNGSGRFQMPTIDADGDLTPRTVQIQVTSGQKPYSAGWTGAYWRVSFSLMVYP